MLQHLAGGFLLLVALAAPAVGGSASNVPGDMDGSCGAPEVYTQGCVDLRDVVVAAEVLTGRDLPVNVAGDPDPNGTVGTGDLAYALAVVSGRVVGVVERHLGEAYTQYLPCVTGGVAVGPLPGWLGFEPLGPGKELLRGTPGQDTVRHTADGRLAPCLPRPACPSAFRVFPILRQGGFAYVDKTAHAWRLAEPPKGGYFLS